MEPIGGDVRRELARFGGAAGTADVVAAWPAAVGAAVSRNAWPARVARDGTLHVTTSSAAWAFELAQLTPDVLERLRSALGGAAPTALRFAVGPVPEPAAPTGDALHRPPEPDVEERRLAAAMTAGLADADLRALVARAAAASLAGARSRRSV